MKAVLKNNVIEIYDAYLVKDAIKAIPGRRWDPKKKVWTLPVTVEAIEQLKYIPGKIEPVILERYRELKRLQDQVKEQKVAEKVEPIEPIPLKPHVKPFQHQIKGYNIAGRILEVFNERQVMPPPVSINRGAALLMEMG